MNVDLHIIRIKVYEMVMIATQIVFTGFFDKIHDAFQVKLLLESIIIL